MSTFDNLFVLGRPAGGKSEFIYFLKSITDEERAKKLHIGSFEEVDDFPWVWEVFMEDDRRAARGEERLHTEMTPDGHILKAPKFREGLVEKFNRAIMQKCLDNPSFYEGTTLLIEFARGKTDGFKGSLEKFSGEILSRAAILYIDVSFEESVRRNNSRFKKDEAGSILSHKVADRDMYEYFIDNDWSSMTGGGPSGSIGLAGTEVPFVTMVNEPESTDPAILEPRYGNALNLLWELYRKK
ncbi:MAG: hypothetical protein V2A66_01935 [Pseudomonadota bacterium]